jgi:hypothetical protein
MMTWIRNVFKKHDLRIVFALSSLIGIALYVYPHSREFGVNVITELASIWITVFLVNRLIEKRERKRRVSIDQRILVETLSIIASYYSIWKHLTWRYVPDAKIETEKDLVAIYPTLLKSAHLSEKFDVVSIHYPESWKLFFHNRTIKDCFENYHLVLQDSIGSLIENFKIHLEPELLGYLLEISESEYLREVNSVFRSDETDVLNEFGQDIDILGSYIGNSSSHFNRIIQLSSYCRQLDSRVAEYTAINAEHYNLKRYFKNPLLTYATSDPIAKI